MSRRASLLIVVVQREKASHVRRLEGVPLSIVDLCSFVYINTSRIYEKIKIKKLESYAFVSKLINAI